MSTLLAGALRAAALITALLVGPTMAFAHGGEDHSHDKPAAAVTTAQPRVAAQSEQYELVGILRGPWLDIYLDRFSTNEPVPGAKVAVTIGGDEETEAEPAPNGTYKIASATFAGSGPLELIFDIKAKAGDDLLIGTLTLPAKAMAPAAGTTPPSTSWAARLHELKDKVIAWVKASPALGQIPSAVVVLTFALGLCVGLLLRRGWRLVPTAALAAVGLLVITGVAFAHEGEDHGSEAKGAASAADTPQRMPDGTVFVPKPSQRLLEVRTTITKPEKAEKAVTLIGRAIADPNRGGVVQSLNGGRVIAPEKGLPRVGQAVKKGEVLAQVEPALPQADRTTISERAGEIEQLIAVAETKLNRIRQLADRGITPQSQVIDAQTEIEGLKRRREIVSRTRVEPETLRAPIDGVVSNAKAVAGQVVQAQDVLFQIVDPKGLWVEALVFNELDPAKIKDASAVASDGTPLKLVFQGFSRALQQQASVVQFAVVNPPP
ncbi:MAG TPA: HlyD family efflux transporter periplasmic adaptor subunit, partial [Sphingomicrobium sp.]|nr:HlyD family efflux transporter periplasmic adaptor subunit [Sphingomicrobium sp.]